MSLLTRLRKTAGDSERKLAARTGLARDSIRACEQDLRHVRIDTIERYAQAFDHRVIFAVVPNDPVDSARSTIAAALGVTRDGFDSWKIHFMDFVDAFRRSTDMRLVMLPPHSALDKKLQALLASIVCALCDEAQVDPPAWAEQEYFLQTPWFVAGVESLKATAILESPIWFRRNNIFVGENFLQRA